MWWLSQGAYFCPVHYLVSSLFKSFSPRNLNFKTFKILFYVLSEMRTSSSLLDYIIHIPAKKRSTTMVTIQTWNFGCMAMAFLSWNVSFSNESTASPCQEKNKTPSPGAFWFRQSTERKRLIIFCQCSKISRPLQNIWTMLLIVWWNFSFFSIVPSNLLKNQNISEISECWKSFQ